MEIKGLNFIGNEYSGEGNDIFSAVNPSNNTKLLPGFHEASEQEIYNAVLKAETAFRIYRKKSGREKAAFLETIAEEIINLGDVLIERCHEETGLPKARLSGERGRTANQLKLFAEILKEGSWADVRIETAMPDRQPLPKPDIRSMYIPLGPVAVFGAGNFPLAFSVAGGDTASALAAGCTVVFKAHPSHPGTSELVAEAIKTAVKKTGMPEGTFSMLHGRSNDVGMTLVRNHLIKAVAFTGSFRGGKAIYDAGVQRQIPVPVFAEMGSTNPVFILPGAAAERGKNIAEGLTASVTLGTGQFCTNPGLVFFEESEILEKFQKNLAENFKNVNSDVMLSANIQTAYTRGIENIRRKKGVNLLAEGKTGEGRCNGTAYLLQTNIEKFLTDETLEEEIFGPSTLIVRAKTKDQMLEAAENLTGHLTATLHASEKDLEEYRDLVEILQRKAGRVIINGYPTGVEVCHSMVHGGPFPATTDSRSTSVGTMAIYRFVRPVCFQNFPDELLPDELKNNNPLDIWRLVNGRKIKGSI